MTDSLKGQSLKGQSPEGQSLEGQSLKGQIALVTGATRGIGKGIAIALTQAGATVYISGRSLNANSITDPIAGDLTQTQSAVEAASGTLIPCQVDHSKDDEVEQLFERIKQEQNGQLDLLVNNVYGGVRALRNAQNKPFWKADPKLWDACNNVGLRSHYIASRLAAQMMVPRKQGLIITISSWGGLSPIFGVAYGTGKSACDRLAAEMAAELKPHNVASFSLWPGIVGTEHISEIAKDSSDSAPMDFSTTRFNWETPLFTGKVIAALATDPNIMQRSGKLQIVAEIAAHYGLTDKEGNRPASLRSLKFLLPVAVPALQNKTTLIPDIRIPWWILLITALAAPKK